LRLYWSHCWGICFKEPWIFTWRGYLKRKHIWIYQAKLNKSLIYLIRRRRNARNSFWRNPKII